MQACSEHRLCKKIIHGEQVMLTLQRLMLSKQNLGHFRLLGGSSRLLWALSLWCFACSSELVLFLFVLFELLLGHLLSVDRLTLFLLIKSADFFLFLLRLLFARSVAWRCIHTVATRWWNRLFWEELKAILDRIVNWTYFTAIHSLDEWLRSQNTVKAMSDDLCQVEVCLASFFFNDPVENVLDGAKVDLALN